MTVTLEQFKREYQKALDSGYVPRNVTLNTIDARGLQEEYSRAWGFAASCDDNVYGLHCHADDKIQKGKMVFD